MKGTFLRSNKQAGKLQPERRQANCENMPPPFGWYHIFKVACHPSEGSCLLLVASECALKNIKSSSSLPEAAHGAYPQTKSALPANCCLPFSGADFG